MISKKLTGLMAIGILSMSVFTGCAKEEVKEEPLVKIDYTQTAESILLNYSQRGMDILKANFPESIDMDLALKNIGRTPNDLSFKTLDGKSVNLKDGKIAEIKDKKIVFEIVQAHCSYCKESAPIIHNGLKDRDDIELVTIFLNSTEADINGYYEEIKLEKPEYVIIDEAKSTKAEFNLTMTPSLIFLDETGKISYIKGGTVDDESLKSVLDTAYGENPIYEMLNEQ